MKPFIGIVQQHTDYLDTWGRPVYIQGLVILERGYASEPPTYDPNLVWSSQGYHYHIITGLSINTTSQLVQLRQPKFELAFWKERLAQIRSVNHADNLKLVSDNLARMTQRITDLGIIIQKTI